MATLSEFHAMADREVKACFAAATVGLVARKSYEYALSAENLGGFMIFDPKRQFAVAGDNFDMSAEAVIAFCENISLSA